MPPPKELNKSSSWILNFLNYIRIGKTLYRKKEWSFKCMFLKGHFVLIFKRHSKVDENITILELIAHFKKKLILQNLILGNY